MTQPDPMALDQDTIEQLRNVVYGLFILSAFSPQDLRRSRRLEPGEPIWKYGQALLQAHPEYVQLLDDVLGLLGYVIDPSDARISTEEELLETFSRVAPALEAGANSPGSVLLVVGEAMRKRTIRLGPKWVKDEDGHEVEIEPVHLLPFQFVKWLATEVKDADEATKRDRAAAHHRQRTSRTAVSNIQGDNDYLFPSLNERLDMRQKIQVLEAAASPEQRTILRLLADGADTAEIAAERDRAPSTVRNQLSRLRKKSAS